MKRKESDPIQAEFDAYAQKQLIRFRAAALSLIERRGRVYRPNPMYDKFLQKTFGAEPQIMTFSSNSDARFALVTSKVAQREMTPDIRLFKTTNEGETPSLAAILSSRDPNFAYTIDHLILYSPKDSDDPYMSKARHRQTDQLVNFVTLLESQQRHNFFLLINCMESILQVIPPSFSAPEQKGIYE